MGTIYYSVVVPAHNESKCLEKLILELRKVLLGEKKGFEIVIVNDNSTDDSIHILKKLKKNVRELVIISRNDTPGVGNAIREGLYKSRGKFIITLDGDLSHDPKEIPGLISQLAKYDMVCGSRYIKGSRANIELSRKIISRTFNIIFRTILGIHIKDFTSGFRAYKRGIIKKIDLKNSNFGIYIEIPLKAYIAGFKLAEFPISYSKRQSGHSNLNYLVQGPEYLKVILEVISLKLSQKRSKRRITS